MAYIYYGYPSHNNINENSYIEINSTDKIFELYENEVKENILKLNKNLEKFIKPDCDDFIKVGVTMIHSVCKKYCDICQNFPNKDIHKWILLRFKSIKNEFYVVDFELNQIYNSWEEYMEKNVLPEGYMFYPNSGFYDPSNTLYQTITPASKKTEKIIKMVDSNVSIVNWVGNAVWVASILFPIATPIVLLTSSVLIISNAYAFSRQVQKLNTMYKHNIELLRNETTQEWINLVIHGIGAIVSSTLVGNAYKAITSDVTSTAQVASRTLKIVQKGSIITQSTLDIFRITLNIVDNNFKIRLENVLHLSLDIFCVTGILYSSNDIKNILKVNTYISY